MRTFRSLALLVLCFTTEVAAAEKPVGADRVSALLESPNLPREIEPEPRPSLAAPEHAATTLTDFRFSHTYLPKLGSNGFGIHDTECAVQVALPWKPFDKPLLVKGGVGVHAWDGPVHSDMPGAVYDFYLDFGWKPRPAEWLFLDFGITPGLYTDLHAFPSEAFRLRGRALAIVALSERLQFVGGALYINRDARKLIPAGGVIWNPSEATQLQLVFPQPKVSQRVMTIGDRSLWLTAAGEFGGGTWAYEQPDGTPNSVDYNDYRAVLGAELRRSDGWNLRLELGYVWGRELLPRNGPTVNPADTMLARLALVY